MTEFFIYNKNDNDFKKQLKIVKQAVPILCKKAISKDYINLDDNSYEFLIVGYSKGSERSKQTPTTITGFMILTELDDNTLEVTLICVGDNFRSKTKEESRGLSKRLFNRLEDLCREKGYNIIQLSALPYVINFYRKLGYRHILDPNCNGKDKEKTKIKNLAEAFQKKKFSSDEEVKMKIKIDKIIQLHIELVKGKKQIKNVEKLEKKISDMLDDEIEEDKKKFYLDYYKKSKRTFGENKTMAFFETLIQENFSSECDDMQKVYKTRQWITEDSDPRCVDEGIIMTKCVDIKPIVKRKKCPNGTRKKKKTGKCEKPIKKRCPNGTRKNKKTGKCE